MKFVVEKGIPLVGDGRGRQKNYPFENMNVGDSFAFPKEIRVSVARAAHYHGKSKGKMFTTRAVDGAYRCWRIA